MLIMYIIFYIFCDIHHKTNISDALNITKSFNLLAFRLHNFDIRYGFPDKELMTDLLANNHSPKQAHPTSIKF